MNTEETQTIQSVESTQPIKIKISPHIVDNKVDATSWSIEIDGHLNDSKILEKICEPIMEAHSKERTAYWEYNVKEIEARTKIWTTVVGFFCLLAIVFGFRWPIFNQQNSDKTQQKIDTPKIALIQDNNDSSNMFINNIILECQTPKIATKTTKKQTNPSDLNMTKDPCKVQK